MIHVAYPAVLSALLLSLGLYAVLRRRNAILVLIGVELMLNAATLLLVLGDVLTADDRHSGQVLALFVITLAAAEIGLGLAIALLVFRQRADINVDQLRLLRESESEESKGIAP